jgi:hypothetical protein
MEGGGGGVTRWQRRNPRRRGNLIEWVGEQRMNE